jgi:hypothetical protein
MGGNGSYFTEPTMALDTAGIDAVMAELTRPDMPGEIPATSNLHVGALPSAGGFPAAPALDRTAAFKDDRAVDQLLVGMETDWFLVATAPKFGKACTPLFACRAFAPRRPRYPPIARGTS